MDQDGSGSRRKAWKGGPVADGRSGWLALNDDDLLFEIEALQPDHGKDDDLLGVLRSDRHFFIRQEAAKKVSDPERLKELSGDRHIGQILVRWMTRAEDAAYLERLMTETRHLEVRKAAEAQLRLIRKARETGRSPSE
jgi:hypothetical protein